MKTEIRAILSAGAILLTVVCAASVFAREMVALTSKVNNESLKEVKNLKSERPSISCYTCHRGAVKPETAPPAPTPAPAPPK